MPTLQNSPRILALSLAFVALASPALAQLDIPGYVPCYPGTGGDLTSTNSNPLIVTINTAAPQQTIHSLGASDAWSTQFIGQWPLAKREAIADLLFESGLDGSNNPQGIALSAWRFNIGAGSSRQNDINDVWRRADTFYNSNFSGYDWTRLPGQRWFLQAAKARGVGEFIAFANSPPTNMTKNGLAYPDSNSGTTNLANGMADDYATYLADIVDHFRNNEGIDFTYISPVNEPQWDWEGGGQEGCRYSNADIKAVVDELATQSGLGSTEIEVPESGDLTYLYNGGAEDYIDAFFDIGSPTYIGDKVSGSVAGHSYFQDEPNFGLETTRADLRAKLDTYPGLEYSMTEYCPLGNYGPGRDLGINPALRVTRVIHFDLAEANASSWQWWLGVSPYDYKDGLVYTDYNQNDGNYYDSKILWGLGNYSRFIRPGMSRVDTSRSDNATPSEAATRQMVSSYYDSTNNILVTVFINQQKKAKAVTLNVQGTNIDTLIPYVTSKDDNLTAYAALSATDTLTIPGKSIVTLVGYQAGGGSSCGDTTCDAGEDSCGCPSDCGLPPMVENSCDDGVDNDCDTDLDCSDSDCDGDPVCPAVSCGNGICEAGEDCNNCSDCPGVSSGKPANRYCCGNGVAESNEAANNLCDGNF